MLSFIRRMRPAALLASWAGYWAVLGITTLSRPIATAWSITRPDAKGSISASFANTVMNVTMEAGGATVYSSEVSLWAVALWIAGPPLALWLVWLLARPGRDSSRVQDTPERGRLREGMGGAAPIREQRERAPGVTTPRP